MARVAVTAPCGLSYAFEQLISSLIQQVGQSRCKTSLTSLHCDFIWLYLHMYNQFHHLCVKLQSHVHVSHWLLLTLTQSNRRRCVEMPRRCVDECQTNTVSNKQIQMFHKHSHKDVSGFSPGSKCVSLL